MDGMIAKMTDAAKQKEATAALDQSKAAMKAGNKTECMKYMERAAGLKVSVRLISDPSAIC